MYDFYSIIICYIHISKVNVADIYKRHTACVRRIHFLLPEASLEEENTENMEVAGEEGKKENLRKKCQNLAKQPS